MIRREHGGPGRRGLTLTEILISILIMGIGLLSLATLFPLGLLRLRDANRASRSALLAASAGSDLTAAGILYKPFYLSLYGYDPFTIDPGRLAAGYGKGVTVCIDPLWWNQIEGRGITNRPLAAADPVLSQVTRFASGMNDATTGFVPNNGSPPSAFGLPRLSPYAVVGPADPVTANRQAVALSQLFGSPDDLVYQSEGDSNPAGGLVDWSDGVGSTLVPQVTYTGAVPDGPLADLSYTWLFTGRQTDIGNGLTFDGDIVILHNRPYSIDPVAGGLQRVANEVVVQAIWGYGPPYFPPTNPVRPTRGYGVNDTSVLLRWPASQPDPEVRIGSWIADVAYPQSGAVAYGAPGVEADALYDYWNSYPADRCYWYRVVRRTDPVLEGNGSFKQMVVTIDRPARAKTPVTLVNGQITPVIVETALVSPNVVMVYPKVLVVK
jgi:prepilin-type N-terminal cleavage/methylation domain-containing protein